MAITANSCIKEKQLLKNKKSPGHFHNRDLKFKPGSDLLSHAVAHAVPLARQGLTSVFGMGTGVTPALQPPGYYRWLNIYLADEAHACR